MSVIFKNSGEKIHIYIPIYYYQHLVTRKEGILSDIIETSTPFGYIVVNPEDVSAIEFIKEV